LNIIGVPKTIDNDVYGTDLTFGFDSAVTIATEAIDRLHSTANSHKRIMVIEVMGHHAGWVALYSGMAGGGDVILIPEIPFDPDTVIEYLEERAEQNKDYSIVVVAEGISIPSKKKKSAGHYISRMIAQRTGLETRETVLGYVQRGGAPTPSDRILATRYGSSAASLIAENRYGNMVALKDNNIISVPLEEIAGKLNLITPDHPLVKKVRSMGTCFGNREEKI
jgi:6-phosphofructokinase 1